MSFTKPTALVTGASSGFGLLTSIALAQKGYHVIATMRDLGKGEVLLAHADQVGVTNAIETMALDVTIHDSIEQVVSDIMDKYGRIDVLINNASFAVGGYVEDVPMEAWRSQLETNVFGVIATTRAVLPHMRAQQSGCIVNVSSVSGLSAFPGYAPYSTSKFAIEGFSESLRLEMMPLGVRVVLLSQVPIRRRFGVKASRRFIPRKRLLIGNGLAKCLTTRGKPQRQHPNRKK